VFHKKVRVRGVFTQCGPQERRPSAELGQAVPTAGDEDYGFLFRYAASIVYGVFLAALFLSMAASVAHFSSGRVLFGLWCLAAIPILPKSALGLILIIARDTPLALMNLPMIFYSVFPGTTTRYRSDNLVFEVLYHRVRNGYLREILWLAVGLVPLLAAAVYTRRASP
jgi:hypothetical protein